MENFHQLMKELVKESTPSVLVTIIKVEGSAYRKAGASMIFRQGGGRFGTISGGCLEEDLSHRAEGIYNTGKIVVCEYDLRVEDDLGWGQGAGCNGKITVLIRDVDAEFREYVVIALNEILMDKKPILLIQSLNNENSYIFMDFKRESFGPENLNVPGEFGDIDFRKEPFEKFTELRKFVDEQYFIQLIWPSPPLYIIGAGVGAQPLAHLAGKLGYAVHLLDWREANSSIENFPSAETVQTGEIVQLLQEINFSPLDSAVVMTHDFQRDLEILQTFKEVDLFYFGILGSKSRTERLFGGAIPSWVHSPVGLSIGADGPWEIAVSITAQLIEKRRGMGR